MNNNNTIVLTSIYNHFWGTDEFYKSCNRVGLPVYNAWQTPGRFTGHGDTLRYYYEALLKLKYKYTHIIFADGADSIFIKSFEPEDNKIIWSAERAIWPPTPDLSNQYPKTDSPYKYLNNGGWCGPINLLIEFFERYGLNKYKGDINGQLQVAQAYLQGLKDSFPIELDIWAKYFQTMAFEDPGFENYEIKDKIIFNKLTGNEPCLIHGNGRVNIEWVYNIFK